MISIILRAKNEMPWVKATIEMLRKQTITDFELLCVDSGSTDGTWEYLQTVKADIIYQIQPEEYIPGKVLNDAINKTHGDIIVFNNADCIPQNEYWLQNLVKPLLSVGQLPSADQTTNPQPPSADQTTNPQPPSADQSQTVALIPGSLIATFANQLPRPDAIPLVKKDYERAFGDGSIHSKWIHFFSLASSAVLREAITRYPFQSDIQYSEDIEWSFRMKKLGYQIAYIPDSIVEHSHNYNLKQIVKRYTGEGKAERIIYEDEYAEEARKGQVKEFNFLRSVVLASGMETLRDWIYLFKRGELTWILKAPLYRFLQRYSAWKGRTGKYKEVRMQKVIILFFLISLISISLPSQVAKPDSLKKSSLADSLDKDVKKNPLSQPNIQPQPKEIPVGGGFILYEDPPEPINPVMPVYPRELIQYGIEGNVILEIFVTKEGKVDSLIVKKSLSPGLDKAALNAVKQWKFLPGKNGGKPCDMWVIVPIEFSLTDHGW